MIDIFATDRLREIYPKVRQFVAEELLPIEAKLLKMHFNQAAKILEEKRQKAKKMGLWAPYLPEKEGV